MKKQPLLTGFPRDASVGLGPGSRHGSGGVLSPSSLPSSSPSLSTSLLSSSTSLAHHWIPAQTLFLFILMSMLMVRVGKALIKSSMIGEMVTAGRFVLTAKLWVSNIFFDCAEKKLPLKVAD